MVGAGGEKGGGGADHLLEVWDVGFASGAVALGHEREDLEHAARGLDLRGQAALERLELEGSLRCAGRDAPVVIVLVARPWGVAAL